MIQTEIQHWEEYLELTDGLEPKSFKLAKMIIEQYIDLIKSGRVTIEMSIESREAMGWRIERIKKYREYLTKTLNATR